jgi:hypothetical protein
MPDSWQQRRDRRGGGIVGDIGEGVSDVLGDTVGAGVNAVNNFIDKGGPAPGKTTQSLRPPKPPAGWDKKSKNSAFYGDKR